MAEIAGKNVQLKIGTTPGASFTADTFVDVGAALAHSFVIGDADVEVTHGGTNQFRKFLYNAGTYTLDVTLDGIYSDSAGESALLAAQPVQIAATTGATAQTDFHNYQIVVPGLGTYTFKGKIGPHNFNAGTINDSVKFELSLMSSGPFTFVSS